MEDLFSIDGLLSDLVNYIVCLLFSIYICLRCRLDRDVAFLLSVVCFVPFLLNGLLFLPSYMPDQFKYFVQTNIIRSFSNLPNFLESGNVVQASYFIAFVPIPVIDTVRSLGFSAKFLYLIMIYFLYKKYFCSKKCLYFLLFYPSLILYSSVGLRDMLILLFMLTSLVYLRIGKFNMSIICALPLYFVKFQNFYIQVIIIFAFAIFRVGERGLNKNRMCFMVLFFYVTALVIFPFVSDDINRYRVAMFVEDGGDILDISAVESIGSVIEVGFLNALYFLLKPFPWEAANLLQLIQSIENIAICAYMFYIGKALWTIRPDRLYFWIIYLFFASLLYGLVVSNFGTATRYRFPFVVCFSVLLLYELNLARMLVVRSRRSKYIDSFVSPNFFR